MPKKKKQAVKIKVRFTRNYRDDIGRHARGDTPTLDEDYAKRMIDEGHAVVYVEPPVPRPAETVKTAKDPSAPKVKRDDK